MAYRTWGPNQELMRLQERMNRLFGGAVASDQDDQLISGSWTPACDIVETKDAVVLRAEAPGLRQEDIDIQIEGNVLTLRGERNMEKESEERTYHRIERSYGSFVRSFTLPRNIDPERISADYRDGILEVSMPKHEESKPRQIRVGVGSGRTVDTAASSRQQGQKRQKSAIRGGRAVSPE